MSIYNINLPKWPAMVVSGSPVTHEQAQDIIFTLDRVFSGHGLSEWGGDLLRVPSDEIYNHIKNDEERVARLQEHWGKEDALRKALKTVQLEYLATDRIKSGWIGGNHGWIDWNGRVYSANYNIGKWPSVTEVRKEWDTIAKLFPYLDLRCTLWAKETIEEGNFPLVAFVVKNGLVRMVKPKKHEDFIPSWSQQEILTGLESILDRKSDTLYEKSIKEAYVKWLARKNIVIPKWEDIHVEEK